MSDPVRDSLVEQLTAALASRPEVLDAYLFGSVARGEQRAHSDLDVAVYVTDDALTSAAFGYVTELGADLQQALGRPDVDLVLLNRATPLLYHRVLRDGVRVLSRDLRATTRREGHAQSRYCDDLPRLRLIEAVHRGRIVAGEFGR